MPEATLTGWLDPIFSPLARRAGIPVAEYSAQVGGEGIGVALEVLSDMFTKGWFNKFIQVGAGLLATGYAVLGRGVPARLRRELLAIGTHEILRIADIDQNYSEIESSFNQTAQAIKNGDWNGALASMIKSPAEVQSKIARITSISAQPRAVPRPAPATRSTPIPDRGISKGKYVVST